MRCCVDCCFLDVPDCGEGTLKGGRLSPAARTSSTRDRTGNALMTLHLSIAAATWFVHAMVRRLAVRFSASDVISGATHCPDSGNASTHSSTAPDACCQGVLLAQCWCTGTHTRKSTDQVTCQLRNAFRYLAHSTGPIPCVYRPVPPPHRA